MKMAQASALRLRPFLIAVLLAVALLAAGCTQFGGRFGGKKGTGIDVPDVYVGAEGFSAAFSPESVPSLVSEGGSSEVLLVLANKGAVAVPEAIVTVVDTKGAFTLENAEAEDTEKVQFKKPLPLIEVNAMTGRESPETVAGSVEGVTLVLKANEFVNSNDSVDTALLATVCYKYGTKLTANVCIDASQTQSFQKQRKVCDAKAPIALKSQGAPVAVKKIEILTEKSNKKVKPKFKIFIGNIGKGLIIDSTRLSLFCTAGAPSAASGSSSKPGDDKGKPKLNIVRLEKVELNGKVLGSGIRCSETEKVLSGNLANDYILCSYEADDFDEGSGTFVTPLKVELSYGYTQTSEPVPVRVEKGFSQTQQNQQAPTTSQPVQLQQEPEPNPAAPPSVPTAPQIGSSSGSRGLLIDG
ncbi:hypothetical protein HYU17_00245 [Candidatus Woesearchaeota archaeon]|nr:hypothetical protein [Candidatus Woesearchaeota archaeon]